MPQQNRVTPAGDIVAVAARGTIMGNRGGQFHRPDQTLGTSRWKSRAWIICRLQFKGRHRQVMPPRGYTELFFLDEATALSAGHRPCFECRRRDAVQFIDIWRAQLPDGQSLRAGDLDRALNSERLTESRIKTTHRARLRSLPDGAMVHVGDGTFLKAQDTLLKWSHDGYTGSFPVHENETVEVLTPQTTLSILAAGYAPHVHESAQSLTVRTIQSFRFTDPNET